MYFTDLKELWLELPSVWELSEDLLVSLLCVCVLLVSVDTVSLWDSSKPDCVDIWYSSAFVNCVMEFAY